MNTKLIKYFLRVLWIAFLSGIILLPTIFIMVKNDAFGWFGGLPSLQALERPDPDLSSELISSDGVSLGKYFRKNRTPVTYEELSSELVNTLLVTEDLRFKRHSGIDLRGLARAISGKLTFSFQGGGSTVTMQLAENLYKTNSDKKGALYRFTSVGQVITKIKEWIIAVQLEESYTKEEILAMYLNTVEFGSNSYGIKVAAKTFFNKLPAQLNYSESAVLVGAINAPTRWSPVLNPENALRKRTEVLWNLTKYDLIDTVAFDTLNQNPIELSYKVDNQNEGLATYFRTQARNFLVSWSKDNGYDLFDDGLKIYTTIDSRLQEYAEQAVNQHMDTLQRLFNEHWIEGNPWIDDQNNEILGFLENSMKRTQAYRSLSRKFEGRKNAQDSIEYYLNTKKSMTVFSWQGEIDTLFSTYDSLNYYKRFLQTGFMAMDPKTGHIKAWVGGIDHKYFKFDHVQQGKRQAGSTFKPFVYAKAIQNNYSPCITAVDVPITIDLPGQDPPTWSPDNAEGRWSNQVYTIRQAMAKSINSITAWMIQQIGPQNVVDMARDLGIESRLAPVYSLALGVADVSLYEMLGAYSTFANKGYYIKPYYISRIEDKNGNIIQQFVPEEKDAINEETAYVMLHMLKGTVEEGSARGLDYSLKVNNEIGAKTGTTQNASDGWFIGVTKNLVAGAWVGGDDRSIRFRDWPLGQGARTAMPIWENFMLQVYEDKTLGYTKGPFERPSKPLSVELDCTKYDQNLNPSDTLNYDAVSADDFM
ncbi:MAG: transglycosylase domain-containing protein [Cyclobacteriaceae bacterium]